VQVLAYLCEHRPAFLRSHVKASGESLHSGDTLASLFNLNMLVQAQKITNKTAYICEPHFLHTMLQAQHAQTCMHMRAHTHTSSYTSTHTHTHTQAQAHLSSRGICFLSQCKLRRIPVAHLQCICIVHLHLHSHTCPGQPLSHLHSHTCTLTLAQGSHLVGAESGSLVILTSFAHLMCAAVVCRMS